MASSLDLNDASTVDWEFATGVYRLNAAKYFMLASFVMLVYDHIITLSHEIDRIWQRQWTGATWLFALNRYLTELQFIVILVSFHDPALTGKRCDKLVPFPGASTMVSIAIAEIILVLRTYALYQRSKIVLVFLSTLWSAQMIVMGTVMRKPTRLVLPAGLVGCIQAGSGRYAVAFWLAPLVMDTVIFALTVFKTVMYTRKNRNRVRLVEVMLRDGVMYFTGIFIANLLNCMLYWLAAENLKVIGASFSQIITVLLISRLQLNLRSKSICDPQTQTSQQRPVSSLPIDTRFHEKRLHSNGTSATISALSLYFETTVSELGRDMITDETEDISGEEVPVTTGACSCGTPRCTCAPSAEPEIELEMGPIRPVSGGVPTPPDMSPFSPQEAEWLDRIIQVSPARLDDTRSEEGVK